MQDKKVIFIIAGEDSGDNIGANLITALKQENPNLEITGIGGSKMQQAGLPNSLVPINQLAIMGFLEVLPKALKLIKLINKTVDAIAATKPDIVITIDSPGFNKRVVKKLRSKGFNKTAKTKFVHYVAPTVWAYKPKRAAVFAELFDHLLCILPFEKPYFDKAGLKNTYVGHPLAEDKFYNSKEEIAVFCQKYGVSASASKLCVMAGSRTGELNKHLPVLKQVLEELAQQNKVLEVFVVSTKAKEDFLKEVFSSWRIKPHIITENKEKKTCFAACNLGLIKSGTSSLEVAFSALPHIVFYKTGNITAKILKRLLKIKYASLVNILKNKEIVPEYIQQDFTAKNLTTKTQELLNNSQMCGQIRQDMLGSIAVLKVADMPSKVAAEAILEQ